MNTSDYDMLNQGSLQLFEALWEHSEDHLFVVMKTEEGEFVTERTNPSLIQFAQMTPEQASGAKLKEILPTDACQDISQKYHLCLSKNHLIHYEESIDMGDGQITYWSTMILPVIDDQTGIQRIFGISRNITQLKQHEKTLISDNEKLEKAVQQRTEELQIALKEMEALSQTDKLTQLCNRHKLDETLLEQIDLSQRYPHRFGLILMDIDNFKSINDVYGHYEGDQALVQFAELVKNAIRKPTH